jgi:putative transposase
VGRKRIRRLMQKMGLCVIYQRPRTTVPGVDHEVYPYLLRLHKEGIGIASGSN